MTFQDFIPAIQGVCILTGVIVLIRIFLSLWAPIDRKINGDKGSEGMGPELGELKDKIVNVHFQSGKVLSNVTLLEYCRTKQNDHFAFSTLLAGSIQDKTVFIRLSEVEYLEEMESRKDRPSG